MILADPKTRAEWLKARTQGIGGSDAGCIVGANPWKSARQLWQEKSGIVTPPDISDKPAVQFGKAAEQHLRALFLLTYPQYTCEHHEFRMYANDRLPFIFATLDGELTDSESRRGILEIKTTTIQNARQWDEWDGKIPQHYYIQILHQFLACEWAEFAELFAHIRYYHGDEIRATMREYHIERSEVVPDLSALETAETTFWNRVQTSNPPPDLLPEI